MAINLEFNSYEDILTFLYTQKRVLFIETFLQIKECIKENIDIANVANLYINKSAVIINVERKDWAEHLEVSLLFFESIEDYEICLEIKELLNNL